MIEWIARRTTTSFFTVHARKLRFASKLYRMQPELNQTLEALLLSTAEPLTVRNLTDVFTRYHRDQVEALQAAAQEEGTEVSEIELPAPVKTAQIKEAIVSITEKAEAEDKAYRVVEGPNGFQIMTAPQYAELVRLLRKEPRPMKLSPAALETLSIVAYRQPVTRAEIEAIRGVSADSALNRLIEHELVHVTGRAELPGRPIQYGTTDGFLEFTGIKELDQLPASDVLSNHQIDDWMRASESTEPEPSDADVGLAEEPSPEELPLDQEFAEIDWQNENAESDAADAVNEPTKEDINHD
jgi:segregation and condensation protein B